MAAEFAWIGTRLVAGREKLRCGGHERRWKAFRGPVLGLGEEEKKNGKLRDLGRKGLEKEQKWEGEEERFLQQLMVGFFRFSFSFGLAVAVVIWSEVRV